MSLTDITEHILSTSNSEAELIRSHARAEVSNIHSETQKLLSAQENEFHTETERIITQTEQKIKNTATQESKLSLEREKNALLESVYSEVSEYITNASDSEYKNFLKKALETVSITDPVTCYAPLARHAITKTVLSEQKIPCKEIKNSPRGVVGIILENESIYIDCSLRQRIADIKKKKNVEVARMLFS